MVYHQYSIAGCRDAGKLFHIAYILAGAGIVSGELRNRFDPHLSFKVVHADVDIPNRSHVLCLCFSRLQGW